jgi:cell division septation protein DedD
MFVRGVMVALGLFCLCGTMFFTGVMVGRGTAPVHFDTRPFQKKLADLADRKNKENTPEKTDLAFYRELKKAVPTDFFLSDEVLEDENLLPSDGETSAAGVDEPADFEGPIPMKKGLKRMTRRADPPNAIPDPGGGHGRDFAVQGTREKAPERNTASGARGGYTIQIASFRQLADAIGRMETLKVKGFLPHRALALVDGKMWHRVRVGKFPDTLSAEKTLKNLEARGIYGIIIQKE